MDDMSPQQQQQQDEEEEEVEEQEEEVQQEEQRRSRGAPPDNKRLIKCQSYRRQSAPSLVLTKALTRSKTLSRESFMVPVCPESCPLVRGLLGGGTDRSFLFHAHAQLKTGMQTQDRHLFLFTDVLVIAKAKSVNHFKQKARASVCQLWTAGCMDEVCEGSTPLDRSFVLGWPTCNCVATFSSAELKEKWLSLLKSRMREEKEKEEPKTIPLRVYGKGINTFAVTKTLPVSNSDSSNEVIRLALQQFGVIGNVREYQLWVISKRDNTPYPLIGHEFPFSIQMSHVRQPVAQGGGGGGGGRDPAEMQVEQLQVYKQCQFILKPRPAEPAAPADFAQKTLKRRRSLIAWAFWRGSASHLNELSLATTSGTARGALFGRPLSSVCFQDALPKPVMDMLVFLYHEGAWTRGIFRRPAGARAVRELRDSLDAGEQQLPLSRDHVFIIAGVFKEFLRSIPGSLLCCELLQEWLDVLEEEEDEEEEELVQDVQRMIGRLPREHGVLLRYLLAMLHGVQAHASENQMTSFNLSVCIAPSMLWPPGAPCSPEVEGEGTKRVCELVRFMIEHCEQILGEDPCALFGGPPQRLNGEETGSESWAYPLTDSSYDSLENELDTSSGGSPTFCARRRARVVQLQGSLDSILTFSDYDQDPEVCPRDQADPSGPGCDSPAADALASLESLSLEGRCTQRRRSEPAICYVSKFRPYASSSADELDDEDETKPGRHAGPKGPTGRTGGGQTASSSSLSSTPASPAYTRSSLDSLDSLDQTSASHRVTPYLSSSTPFTPPHRASPKEPLHWGTLKGCRGLHPNSWLKKDRRLSLTQQENLEKEDGGGGAAATSSLSLSKTLTERGATKTASKNRTRLAGKGTRGGAGESQVRWRSGQEQEEPSSPPTHHRSTGSLLFSKPSCFQSPESPRNVTPRSVPSEPKQALFYRPGAPSLSLFKRHKSYSVEEECHHSRLRRRRGSEPGRQIVEQVARDRLPSDPGLKGSQVSGGDPPETRFCLSPHATKAVRDYFSSHPRSDPRSGQQVALALAESRREWLQRCSDPAAEPDFDQLLFAEESYV